MQDEQPKPQSAPAVRVIHALRYGQALCGIAGVPAQWPEGHVWIAAHYCDPKEITCVDCKAKYDVSMKRQMPGWRDDDPNHA